MRKYSSRHSLLGMAGTEWMVVMATLGAGALALFYTFFPDFRERFDHAASDQRSLIKEERHTDLPGHR